MVITTTPAALLVPAPARPTTTPLGTSTLQIAHRALLRYLRTPQLIVLGTVQGAMFLLIFRYVFGGAIHLPQMSYVDFLVPGFITTGVLFSGMGAATVTAEDLQAGFVDRLRSLPIPRIAFLAGRALADCCWNTWGLAVSSAIAFAVGFRLHASLLDGLGAFALCIVFGFAFEWMMVTIGLVAGNAQAAQGMSMLVFPLTFVSSAYVPVASMPGWLQGFATHQPLTYMVNAVRTLTEGPAAARLLGHPATYWSTGALLWCAALVALFGPLAAWRYARR